MPSIFSTKKSKGLFLCSTLLSRTLIHNMALKLANTFWRAGAIPKDYHAAWQLSNGTIRLTIASLGGHIA